MDGLYKLLLFPVLACLGRNVLGSEIINGEIASEDSMLYMASVQENRKHVCGGFLVSEDFVVTAAQCDVDLETTLVILGTQDLKKVNVINRAIVKKCKPARKNNNESNDIMLLKLLKNNRKEKKVPTIPLPTPDMNVQENEQCLVAGWGFTGPGTTLDNELRVVNVTVINQQECKQKLPALRANVICAGGYDKGSCKGYAGGPLVCDGKAVGVASCYEKECKCRTGALVYTHISKFLPWINKVLEKNDC
ncbi:granzyme-like protein 1 [Cottoperca gobio]|uniref:Granzyme-like protein 1 n=1 Tax=Cottoperca gobio TaxID=56716 RepID=A0A6J2PJL2_COTGO|nr:granzyme-like protein 1 [Cottoperca gobio]